ncbi:MAG TPA: cation transporter [Ktedonobacteraceae bacterium]|nr:cation transporter [Ktedonobacteraceae bacterium]
MSVNVSRAIEVRSGIRIEVFTVIWMVIEAAVSIGAGIIAGSTLLTAFGLDSVIELVSGTILLWRLLIEAREGDTERVERAEHRAAWIVALSLALLCAYVFGTALYGLLTHSMPESSPVGIGVSIAAVIVMPWLAITKRRIAKRIESGALRGDAASSLTCGYMAATVLVGLALNTLFHWWWAEDIAAFVFLFWLVQETLEAFEEARSGKEEGNDD